MKLRPFVLCACVAVFLSGCATFYGGRRDASQREKPQPGQQNRKIRWGYFIADLCTLQGALLFIPIDFLTGNIYRPLLPDSVRRARILQNKREKQYISLGTNLIPLAHGSAEITSEYRISPALGISGSVLRAWNTKTQGFYYDDSETENRQTSGYAARLGLRAYPVAIFSPEVRSGAEFYLGADLLGTSFEQQVDDFIYGNTTFQRVRRQSSGRLLAYALTYGSVFQCSNRVDFDTSLQFSSVVSRHQLSYINNYLPGLGSSVVGEKSRLRLNFGIRYRF